MSAEDMKKQMRLSPEGLVDENRAGDFRRKVREDMQPLDLNDFIEFNDQKVNPVVLANEPDMRLLLLCMRAGQQVPEHSAAGSITVQAITGRATFYDGEEACEMYTGSLVRLDAGRLHRVEAHTDVALLVTMIKPSRAIELRGEQPATEREIDLCLMGRAERHPLVFAAFDRLAVGESFIIHNDHDPQPLPMQIEQMREGEISWEYIERGPETFSIRITRITPPTRIVGPVSAGTAQSLVRIGESRQSGRLELLTKGIIIEFNLASPITTLTILKPCRESRNSN